MKIVKHFNSLKSMYMKESLCANPALNSRSKTDPVDKTDLNFPLHK